MARESVVFLYVKTDESLSWIFVMTIFLFFKDFPDSSACSAAENLLLHTLSKVYSKPHS